ncbi:MAG: fatty acid desaturase [Deltaproteobacteria bacterium]|nr:fatty acid desaturase [Deltaproteobacteria bacterium]
MLSAHPSSQQDEASSAYAATDASALRPDDGAGLLIVLGFSLLTAFGLWLTFQGEGHVAVACWLAGQLVLGVSFLQWFVVLHETGHGVLFRGRAKNALVGHVAGFITLIPFHAWQPIHQKHHIWAGWQDRDPTTMALVPRPLGRAEKAIIDFCWKSWLPLFSLLYRVNNFWNVGRLLTLLPRREVQTRLLQNVVVVVIAWVCLLAFFGPLVVLQACGLAMAIGFALQEPIMLSQHTHIPLRIAGAVDVDAFTPAEQVPFTRSLRFPNWFSTLVLLHFDAHELHHEHPNVPGWRLRALDRPTPNDIPALQWIRRARAVPAHVFLFSNRDRSGLDL